MNRSKQVAVYVPHGSIPDMRGFAPAIVAYKQVMNLSSWKPSFYSARVKGSRASEHLNGMPVQRFSPSSLYRRLFQKVTRLDPFPMHARLARRLRHAPPDVLHVHQLEFPIAEFRAHGFPYLPIVVHAHVTTQRPQAVLADRYIAVSQFVKSRLIEKGFPTDRISVISNGVDLETFKPLAPSEKHAFRQAQGIPQEGPVLIFFGRKQLVKGFDIFLSVAEKLLSEMHDITVLAIGPEPEDSKLAPGFTERGAQRQRLAAGGRFRELGPMTHTELAKWIAAADVALLPSRTEPQGMAMLESMATGCLTVSADVGGIRESILHEQTGWLLSPEAPLPAWCELVARIIRERESLRQVADAAVAHVSAAHDWTKLSQQLELVYDEIIAKK